MSELNGWQAQRSENAKTAGRTATRNARRRALKEGRATPILSRGKKIAPDAQDAIERFLAERTEQ